MKINEKDAYTTWGAYLLAGGLAALLTPPSSKAYIESVSRLQHGKRVVRTTPNGESISRFDSRDVTLSIAISGKTIKDLKTKLDSLIEEFMRGTTKLQVAEIPDTVYRLDYISCTQFSQLRGLAKIAIKFNEPNPYNRTL
ncbi:MAG: hypothetical protein HDR49_00140 [Bacteroides sp.]|nr:hypothetical protein [Bacteroides sp.]